MSSASPGPWSVSPTDDTVVIDATQCEVAAIDGDYNDPDTWPQMEANARLIAAAPEMLAALRAIVIESGGKAIPNESLTACRNRALAAIAKAEGRSDA